jgi:transposase-like protein
MTQEEIQKQYCTNKICEAYGRIEHGNIGIHDSRKNRFRCKLCGKTWVGHYGHYSYGLKTSLPIANRAQEMIKAGLSIRNIANLSCVSPSTIFRWKKKLLINS